MERVSLKTFSQMVQEKFKKDGVIKGINGDERFKNFVKMLFMTFNFEMTLSRGLTAQTFLDSCTFNYDEIAPTPSRKSDS